jgi:hypothetical protein
MILDVLFKLAEILGELRARRIDYMVRHKGQLRFWLGYIWGRILCGLSAMTLWTIERLMGPMAKQLGLNIEEHLH